MIENAGITASNEEGDRVQIAGYNGQIVRQKIDSFGRAAIEINKLGDRNEVTNKARQIVFVRLIE